MPLTALEPKPALIVIDLQKAFLSRRLAHPPEEIVGRAASLVDAFRRAGLPIVFCVVNGAAPGRTDRPRPNLPAGPEILEQADQLDVRPRDYVLIKQTRSAFHNTPLDAHLQELGVTQVVLAGVSTTSGVESTAREAHDQGYHVVLVTDAMTDTDPEAHRNSLERIFPKVGETTTTAELLAFLSG